MPADLRYAQTMTFTTLVFFSFFVIFNARSDEQSAFVGMFANKWLWGAVLLSLLLQVAVVYVPLSAGSVLNHGAEPEGLAPVRGGWQLGVWLGEFGKLLRR